MLMSRNGMSKKKWAIPQLIVLVRGQKEEMVLAACKSGMLYGPSVVNDYCDTLPDGCSSPECSEMSLS